MRSSLLLTAFLTTAITGSVFADTLELTGLLRDFKRGDRVGGHPDFETANNIRGQYGLVPGLVTMGLSQDGKPVYNPTRPSNDTMYSAEHFNMWFRDTANVNTAAAPFKITLSNGKTTPGGVYSYTTNAFFPLDGKGFGNEGLNHNFHFTFELHTKFTYQPGQNFTFVGDDDVWVYINGVKVIDLGGVHSAQTGNVLLFDGKAFVSKTAFPAGGTVLRVSTNYASKLVTEWSKQGMSGSCPIKAGDSYIDLGLTSTSGPQGTAGSATINTTFPSSTSVAVTSTKTIDAVTLKFKDNVEQRFTSINNTTGTFSGTGANAGKQVIGAWVYSGGNSSTAGPGYGQWYSATGSTGTSCKLDFFFAERHTTESNFRIDTSISLDSFVPDSIVALYD